MFQGDVDFDGWVGSCWKTGDGHNRAARRVKVFGDCQPTAQPGGRHLVDKAPIFAANGYTRDLKKGVNSLATIGTTAPFVGLLGTVVGVINAFTGIAATGSGGIGAVSAGIAEALVETALGLVVAIPAVWFYNYLTGRLEYFNVEMDNSSSEMVDYFVKKSN